MSLKIEYEFSPINLFGEDVLKKINLNYDKNKKNKNIIQNYNNKIILKTNKIWKEEDLRKIGRNNTFCMPMKL